MTSFIVASITGDLWTGERREPAGCAEICPTLIAAMGTNPFETGKAKSWS
jgi:hypothetical protein